MEPVENYTFKVEMSDDSDSPIKTEPIQDDSKEDGPTGTEPFQDDSIKECPIKTEISDDNILPETPREEDPSLEDPLKPSLWRQILDSQAKLMILNVHSYIRKLKIKRATETGEDMNVTVEVARATGASYSAVKKLVSKYHNEGLEKAIVPGNKKRNRKRKTVTLVDAGENSENITVKKKQKIIISN